jgi:hypothetical protein
MPRPKILQSSDRFTRIVVLVWVVAGVIILTTVFRALTAIGLFTYVSEVSPAVCRPIPLPGAGALAYETKSKTLFIAARDPRNPSASGAIYALPDGAAKPVRLSGTPPDFHPTALSVGYNVGGEPALTVLDRKANGTVAVGLYGVSFDAKGVGLQYQSTIQSGLARRAQGIAALGNDRFYLTANPTSNVLMDWADRWLVLGRAYLLFYNGTMFRQAVSGISDPSSVAVSADGQKVYVASRAERRLIAFSREEFTGTLTELDSVTLPLRPEQIGIDASNVLWVAGPARLPELSGASRVVRVFLGSDGAPQTQETVYAGNGITAATGVARGENQLFIGSFRDDKMLACDLK